VTRTRFQRIAEERVRDAQALLDAGQWSGAYYLSGYATECGLKACIARLTNQDDYPNKKFANSCFTHNIEDLVKLAGLEAQRQIETSTNPGFGTNWLVTIEWDEQARYQEWTELEARKLFMAVTDSTNGVLIWIKGRW